MPEARGALVRLRQLGELAGTLALLSAVRALPMAVLEPATTLLARTAFICLGRRRRRIAVDNVTHALGVDGASARGLARAGLRSFLLTAMPEIAKLRGPLTATDALEWMRRRSPELTDVFARARELHDTTGGCIFVTPHLGNWELLPFVAAAAGIPLAVVARPLDNPHLERLLLANRTRTGHVVVARRNSLLRLQQLLASGHSVGILPDQAVQKGLPIPFLGRTALTTPVPALLALYQQRPIVVVACIRTGRLRFDGHLSAPIWPEPGGSEKAEVLRLTTAMNQEMETVVRAHPQQYFWLHDRWKSYD
jgi:Kdo2-lipid IVA lauroyltransferase/acyltransferase